jgi:hypothetical protein
MRGDDDEWVGRSILRPRMGGSSPDQGIRGISSHDVARARVGSSLELQIDDVEKLGDVQGLHEWLADRRGSGLGYRLGEDFVIAAEGDKTGVDRR